MRRRGPRDADVERLAAAAGVRLNLEMAATDEMVAIARRLRPAACCLVPERRAELTTEGGLDAAGHAAALRPQVAALRDAGIRVSLFIDPAPEQIEASSKAGAQVVELHTGRYCEAALEGDAEALDVALDRLRVAQPAQRGADLVSAAHQAAAGST